MKHNSVARFTATALIVAAFVLFIVAIIPVIAVGVGGLGAGWGAGSRAWLVFPLAVGACSGALLLLAFGAMLLVLTRIQDNLYVWRQRQVEAADARAAAVAPAPAALGTSAAAAEVITAGTADAAAAESVPASPESESRGVTAGAALAGAGVVAAAAAADREEQVEPEAVVAETPEGEPGPVAAAAEAGAAGEESKGPGLGAVLAGAGIAAVAIAHDKEAEPAAEEGAPLPAEAKGAEAEASGPGVGAVLAGAGIAAAVAAGTGEEEGGPEAGQIPASAPEPEPGAPSVEITEAEAVPPVVAEEGGPGGAAALAAAGIAAAALHEEQAEAQPDTEAGKAVVTAAAIEAAASEPKPPAEATHPTAWAYDEGTANVTKAAGAVKVEGIGQVYAGKLKELGITTTAALLRAGATPKGRKELAEQSGISPKQILKWVNRVDLARIKGISEQYADLLEAAGVDTVPELAQRNPDSLYQKLVETNEAKRLVRRLPTLGMVSSWIAQAKELPRVILYK
jgi:predicted flap endonuclease-1-like 5' DNA nuclease